MSDHIASRHDAGHDASGAGDHATMHRTISGAGPVRPEEGSPLQLLLRRQTGLAGGRLIGFVPAQVR